MCRAHPLLDCRHLRWRFPTPSSQRFTPVVGPTTPRILRYSRFGLLPFRSPLLRESRLISSRRATEMFQFARCPPFLPMCSAGGIQPSCWMGCPIRILRAHRLYAAPPERFAGLRVLHRPSVPRHPPRTLCSLFLICVPLLLSCSTAKLKKDSIQLFMCRLSVSRQLESGKQPRCFLLKAGPVRPGSGLTMYVNRSSLERR